MSLLNQGLFLTSSKTRPRCWSRAVPEFRKDYHSSLPYSVCCCRKQNGRITDKKHSQSWSQSRC